MNRRAILKKMSIVLAVLPGIAWSSYAFGEGQDHDDEHEEHADQHPTQDNSVNVVPQSNEDNTSEDQVLQDIEGGEDDDDIDDEVHALQVTQDNQVMPLRKIIGIFRREVGGTIIEITLLQRQKTLIYRFQFINNDGHVGFVKYDAATGKQIEN